MWMVKFVYVLYTEEVLSQESQFNLKIISLKNVSTIIEIFQNKILWYSRYYNIFFNEKY